MAHPDYSVRLARHGREARIPRSQARPTGVHQRGVQPLLEDRGEGASVQGDLKGGLRQGQSLLFGHSLELTIGTGRRCGRPRFVLRYARNASGSYCGTAPRRSRSAAPLPLSLLGPFEAPSGGECSSLAAHDPAPRRIAAGCPADAGSLCLAGTETRSAAPGGGRGALRWRRSGAAAHRPEIDASNPNARARWPCSASTTASRSPAASSRAARPQRHSRCRPRVRPTSNSSSRPIC